MLSLYFEGVVTGAGLIVAIGAQNAFVLSCGIRQQQAWLVAGVCALCDTVLILVGALTAGSAVALHPTLQRGAAVVGAIFLFLYGCRSLCRVFKKSEGLAPASVLPLARRRIVATTLCITLLNPHVYLDTVLLLGTIAGQYGEGKYLFSFGALSFSWAWFFLLAGGGSRAARFFARPLAWKILDLLVTVSMWLIAYRLLLEL